MKRFWKKVGFILAFLAAPMSCGEDPFGLTTETVSVFLRQNFPKFEFTAISTPMVSLKDTVTFNLSFSNEDQDAVDFQILPEYVEIQKVSGDASCDISKIEAKEKNTASVRMIRGTYVVSANNCTGNGVIKFLIGDKFWGQFDGRIESPGDVVSDVLTVDNLGPTIEFLAPETLYMSQSGTISFTLSLSDENGLSSSTPPSLSSESIQLISDEGVTCTDFSFADQGGGVYQVTVGGCTGDGTFYLSLPSVATVLDTVGNPSQSKKSVSITVDNTGPSGHSVSIDSGVTYTSSTSVTLTLAASDTNGVTQMFLSNSATFASGAWEAFATSKAWMLAQTNATATVYVKFKDAAGNESTGVSDTIIHDSIQPSATITSSTVSNGGVTATSPAAFTVTFSESVTGFISGDVTVGNGSVSSFAGSGTTYTFDITGMAKGAVTVDISANKGFDAVGNGNTAATQFAFTFDQQPPTISDITNKTTLINTALSGIAVTITDADNVLNCTTSLSVSSSNPTLIDTGDFVFSGTAPNCSIALTPNDYQTGTSIITVTVTDGVAASNQSDRFTLTVPTIVVESVYSTNGRNWNDYVKSDGSSCTGDGVVADENKWNKCIHGGERKKVAVPWESSCSNLALSDALGAFTWTCSNSGGYAIFYSSELNVGKKLSTLIDFTTTPKFAVNSATLQKNSSTVTSDNTDTVPWWTNTITELPDNSSGEVAVLSSAGTIYVLSDSQASNGYNINADKVALVIKDGATLTYGGSATYNCVRATGESTGSPNYTCLVSAGSQKFLWIEGDFNGTPASGTTVNHVLHFYGAVFSKFRYVEVYGANYIGLSLLRNTAKTYHNNTAQYIYAHNIKGVPTQTTDNSYGINFDTNYSLLTNFSTANNEVGIYVSNCDWCVIQDGKLNNNSIYGHYSYGSDYAVHSRVQITNNPVGMRMDGGYWNTYVQVLVANNATVGVDHGPSNSWEYGKDKWHNVSILNNGTYGIYLKQGNNTYSQMLNAGNGQYAIYEYSAEWHAHRYTRFTGVNLYSTSSTAGCYILYTPDGYNGIVSCSAFGVYNQNPTFIWNVNATDLMNTYITSNDTSNSSDTNGAASYSTSLTFDWHNFSTPTRSWGKAGNSSYIDSSNRGVWSSGTGRIWEWGYSSASALFNKSGNGADANADFVNGGTCPSQVHGNQIINFMFSAPGVTPVVDEPYLKAAVEVLVDGKGDDDGLCETNEACIYAPNIGYYQGHGDYTTRTCNFQNGTITGVTMYAYPTNGR